MEQVRKATLLTLLCILIGIPEVGRASDGQKHLRGFFDLGYRYRGDGNFKDQDLTQRLSLDYFRPWTLLGKNAEVGFVFSGMLKEDLDGDPDDAKNDPFREIADAYKDSTVGWLYEAYIELAEIGALKSVRIGRQTVLEMDAISLDGALAELEAGKFTFTAFGGRPANLYEDPDYTERDTLAGGLITYQALKCLSLGVGYLGLHDKVLLLNDQEATLNESLVLFKGNFKPMRGLNFSAEGWVADGEFRDASLLGLYRNYDLDLVVKAMYRGQFVDREDEPLGESSFGLLLGSIKPYHMGSLNVYKGLGERFGVELGAVSRMLADDNDESTFNHFYQRYMGSVFLYNLPFRRSELVLGVDWWVATGTDIESQSYRGEFAQRFGKRGKIKAGVTYDLFKIDIDTGNEEEDVYTYYVGALLPLGKHLYIGADYIFEDGSIREIDTIKARVGYEF